MAESETKAKAPRSNQAGVLLTLLVFIVIAGVLLGLAVHWRNAGHEAIAKRQQLNLELGLSADYPSDLVPLYSGIDVTASERGSARSTDDEPMDMWRVKGETDHEPQVLFDYYSDLMLGNGLCQTTLMSIPTGYGVYYANERGEVRFTFEHQSDSERTSVEIIVYLLRE